jgi:hypothetical protein
MLPDILRCPIFTSKLTTLCKKILVSGKFLVGRYRYLSTEHNFINIYICITHASRLVTLICWWGTRWNKGLVTGCDSSFSSLFTFFVYFSSVPVCFIVLFWPLDLDPGYPDPGSGKIRIRDWEESGSGMSIPDRISESLFFGLKVPRVLKICYVDPDSLSRIFLTLDPPILDPGGKIWIW